MRRIRKRFAPPGKKLVRVGFEACRVETNHGLPEARNQVVYYSSPQILGQSPRAYKGVWKKFSGRLAAVRNQEGGTGGKKAILLLPKYPSRIPAREKLEGKEVCPRSFCLRITSWEGFACYSWNRREENWLFWHGRCRNRVEDLQTSEQLGGQRGSGMGVGRMRRMNYSTMVDRGRKAGLGTGELYRALATRRPEASDGAIPGETDSNGFVPDYNGSGQRIYRPVKASATL